MCRSPAKWSRVVTKEVANKRKERTEVFKRKEGKEYSLVTRTTFFKKELTELMASPICPGLMKNTPDRA